MSSIRVGRYEVQELLGEGGMGKVYRALDPMLERTVAMKVIHPKRMNAEARERFFREARAVARLDSPYIVKIFDIGIEPDGNREMHYIVMEYVSGHTLTSKIGDSGTPPSREQLIERLKFFWQLLKSMQYAHQQGVVHRDLKPDNVMITKEGRLKIMDFGLAILDDRHSQTRDDQIMGTLAYFAPEQAKGGKGVDHRADIYSLGVILFELSTGSLPILGNNPVEMITRLIHDPPPNPSSLNPDLPWPLEKMILQALRKEPQERYQTCAQMIADLELILKESFQVASSKLDPDALPDLEPPKPEPPKAAPQPQKAPVIPNFPLNLPKMPPPPTLEATKADWLQRLQPEVAESIEPAAKPAAEEKPAAVAKTPNFFMRVQNQPVVTSQEWMAQANSSASVHEDKLKKDEEKQQLILTDVAQPGKRQTCSGCGASVAIDAKSCPECGKALNASKNYFVVSREARELAARAAELLGLGEYEQALETATKAVQSDPELGEAYLYQGRALLGVHRLDEAEIALDRAAELMPESSDPFLVLAELFLERKDFEEVIACLLDALRRRPTDVETRCRLAFLYSETGRINEALEQYRQVLRTHPRHLVANRQMGVLLAGLERNEEAIKYLERAQQLEPNDSYSCTLLGRLYAKRRNFQAAQEAFQTAIQIKGEDATLRAELGALFQAQNREDLAIQELRRAIEVDRTNREARLRLANLYERHGRLDYAVRELEEALRHHPQDLVVHRRLGELYLQHKDLNRALLHFENVVRLDPKCAEMHNRLGKIYLKKDYTKQSIEHYKQAVELRKVEPEFREDLAMAYYCQGDYPAAIRELSRAAQLDGRNPEYFKGLGMLNYQVGQDEDAVRHLQWSLQLNPTDAQAHGMLGQSLQRRGLTNMAITEFSKALELEPSLHILQLFLARALAAAGRHQEAIQSFKNFASKIGGLDEFPLAGQAYSEMGFSYLAESQPARAAEVFEMALQRNPKDSSALHGLARVALSKRDYKLARKKLAEANELEPRNREFVKTAAEIEATQDRWDEAIEVLKKGILEFPNDSSLVETLGRTLRKAGRLSDAGATFREAAERFPVERWRFMWLEGRVEHRRQQYGRAAWLFRQALEIAPHNYMLQKDLAEACARLGELDEAVSILDKALQMAPESARSELAKVRTVYQSELTQRRG